jgi:hypothetical protein
MLEGQSKISNSGSNQSLPEDAKEKMKSLGNEFLKKVHQRSNIFKNSKNLVV